MTFSSLADVLNAKMTNLHLPLWSFRRSEAFLGIVLPHSLFVFSDFSVQLPQLQPTYPVKSLHKSADPLIVSQDTIHDPTTCADDLHR